MQPFGSIHIQASITTHIRIPKLPSQKRTKTSIFLNAQIPTCPKFIRNSIPTQNFIENNWTNSFTFYCQTQGFMYGLSQNLKPRDSYSALLRKKIRDRNYPFFFYLLILFFKTYFQLCPLELDFNLTLVLVTKKSSLYSLKLKICSTLPFEFDFDPILAREIQNTSL